MEFTGGEIRTEKELNELDKLTLSFLDVLEEHTEYVIVSGYVSILLGRARATEDVDLFIPEMDKGEFLELCTDLEGEGFWCLNTTDDEEAYSYLDDGLAVRFAREGEAIPNFEVKFARGLLASDVFDDTVDVVTPGGTIVISSLERQIAFKRYYLGSEKDLEDARHVEEVFGEHINEEKVEYYRERIENADT